MQAKLDFCSDRAQKQLKYIEDLVKDVYKEQ